MQRTSRQTASNSDHGSPPCLWQSESSERWSIAFSRAQTPLLITALMTFSRRVSRQESTQSMPWCSANATMVAGKSKDDDANELTIRIGHSTLSPHKHLTENSLDRTCFMHKGAAAAAVRPRRKEQVGPIELQVFLSSVLAGRRSEIATGRIYDDPTRRGLPASNIYAHGAHAFVKGRRVRKRRVNAVILLRLAFPPVAFLFSAVLIK
uniref:Uncharacterized protein n=1 Tax=Plectus sambesii TaxID=2011161 RepID=A0A914VRT9_9BILA